MYRTRTAALIITAAALATLGATNAASAHRGHSHDRVVASAISIDFRGGGDDMYAEQANFTGTVTTDAGHGHWRRPGRGHGHVHWVGHGRRGGSWGLEQACASDRTVRIVHVDGGQVLRETSTGRDGTYGVLAGPELVAGDDYRAEVLPKTLRIGPVKVVCEGAASEAVTAG